MKKQTVYDGFLFFNELDLLEIRLNELKDVVDCHIIVESPVTFSGNLKPLFFKENVERFKPWLKKIVYLSCANPCPETIWDREYYQRDAIAKGLYKSSPSDVFIMGDIDEIPRPSAILEAIDNLNTVGGPQCLETQLYFYGLNYPCYSHPIWPAPFVCLVKDLTTPQGLRGNDDDKYNRVKNGGWHYSYLGSPQSIKYKIESFSHGEFNKDEIKNNDNIRSCIEKGISLIPGCDRKFERININYDNSPRYLVDNLDRYKHLLV